MIPDNFHIRLFAAKTLLLRPGYWNARNVQSSFWRFYCNANDGAALEMTNGIYPLKGGQLYLVPAGVFFSCRNETEVNHFYIHFDVIGLPRIAMRELFYKPLQIPPVPKLTVSIQEISQAVVHAANLDFALHCRIKAVLYETLGQYLESLTPEQRRRCGQLTEALAPVLPAVEYIEEHLGERLSNTRLAELCHLSEAYFIRSFRTHVGQSPAQYVLERRVIQASQRLLFSEQSIEKIAEDAGFGNRFYFSRIFSRHMGLSPAAFRKAERV